MEFITLWNILLRRRWIFITSFVVFFGMVVVLTNILSPIYTGKTLVWIDSSSTTSSLMTQLGVQPPGNVSTSTESKYKTEIALATVRPVLSKLVKKLGLMDGSGKPLDPDKLVDSKYTYYLNSWPHVSVDLYEDSSALLQISAYSRDPAKAAQISYELANLYIEKMRSREIEGYKSTQPFLQDQIKNVKKEYERTLMELKDFMGKEKTYDLSIESQSITNQIYSVRQEYEDNEKTILGFEKSVAESREKMKGMGIFREASQQIEISDQMNVLKTKLNELLISISEKGIDFTKEHPEYRKLEANVDSVRKLINEETEFRLSSKSFSVDPVYDDLYKGLYTNMINIEVGIAKRKLLKRYIDTYQRELMKLPKKSAESQKINLELSVMKDSYSTLLKYQNDVNIAKALLLSKIKLVEPAVKPTDPEFPNKKLNYVLGLFFGVFWSLLVALFMEYIDTSIKTPEDLKRACDLVLLGMVQKSKQLIGQFLIMELPSTLSIIEAYRIIKNNIKYISVDRPLSTILITSSIEDEGKSTTAAILSTMLSSKHKKVLLIDLDLRCPSIHRYFNLNNNSGVTNILTESNSIEDVLSKTNIENLDVLTSGPIPIDPTRLIESDKVKELISNLKELYDLIVIDSPPALAVHDAVVLGTLVDGVICIIQSGKVSADMIKHTNDLFNKANIKILGTILTKVRLYETGHYHSYYNGYHR